MKLTVTFNCDGSAFFNLEDEVRSILERTADDIDSGGDFGRIRDSNGNRVGFWHFEEGDDCGDTHCQCGECGPHAEWEKEL